MQRESSGKKLTRGGQCLVVALTALCLVAVSPPVEAQDDGGPYGAIFGGFAVYPAPYVNGGTLHTKNSKNSFHVFSSLLIFDPVARTISGEGPFTMVTSADTAPPGGPAPPDLGETIQGSWKAVRLTYWEWEGECSSNPTCLEGGPFPNPLHPSFTAGKMKAIIVLYDGDGEVLGRAVLTIWCSLPGIPFGVDTRDPDGRGIEQYRVKIISGRHKGKVFEIGRSGTVFINLPKFLG